MEIFHHLGTYGNVEDEATGGWSVRHVPLLGGNFPPLVDAPDDLEIPHDVCQPVLLGTEKVLGPVFPASHIFGHSDAGSLHAHAVLSRVRPLRDQVDQYVLLLSVESWTHFGGRFGDAGNFEVWMRSCDLDEGRFDRAWCMIRTD